MGNFSCRIPISLRFKVSILEILKIGMRRLITLVSISMFFSMSSFSQMEYPIINSVSISEIKDDTIKEDLNVIFSHLESERLNQYKVNIYGNDVSCQYKNYRFFHLKHSTPIINYQISKNKKSISFSTKLQANEPLIAELVYLHMSSRFPFGNSTTLSEINKKINTTFQNQLITINQQAFQSKDRNRIYLDYKLSNGDQVLEFVVIIVNAPTTALYNCVLKD